MSKERFRFLFNNSLDAMVVADDNGRYLDVNQAACALFGYSREEILNMHETDLTSAPPPGAKPLYQEYLQKGQQTGEFSFVHSNGEERVASYSACQLAEGEHISILHDITAQKREEHHLLREKDFIENALDSLPGIFYVIDTRGMFLRWNKNFEIVSGYSEEEVARMNPLDFFEGEDKGLIAARMLEVFEKGVSSAEATFVSKQGNGVPYFFTGKRTLFENEMCLVGMGIDISVRERAEAALRRSEARYRQLTEAMPQLAWITNSSGVPEYFNQGWYDFTGTTLESMLEKNRPSVIHPEDQEKVNLSWEQAIHSNKPFAMEYRLRRSDGVYRWVLTRGVPLLDDAGAVIQWFGTCTDIEAQKRAVEKERFLADSSATLASSLDYETTLSTVAGLAVPHLADWCSVYVIDGNGSIRRLVVAHADPEKVKWAHELNTRYPLDLDATRGIPNVLRTGLAELYPDVTEDMLIASARDEEHLGLLRALELTSVMMVPMVVRGRAVGAITFVSTDKDRPYTPADLAVAQDLAASAALAMENARLFQAERERSEQLSTAISEVHHRVKNNLQSVAALLEMQIPDKGNAIPLEAIHDSLSQIKTIALVHDLLARDKPVGFVDISQVVTKLASLLSASMGTNIEPLPIHVRAEALEMATRTATSLALALNELLTNAAKHNDIGRNNSVTIELRRDAHQVYVTVEDKGPGFPNGFDAVQQASIGLSLVTTLVQHDLRGHVHFMNRADHNGESLQRGARVEIVFPVNALND